VKKWRFVAPFAALAAVAVVAVSLVGSGAAAPTAGYKAGIISDVARFNDKGFNQSQLKGLKFAQTHISGLQIAAVESHSAADYLPNFASLSRKGYNLVIGAGYLLAPAVNTVAKQYPKTLYAITDVDVTAPPFNGKLKNVAGMTYATQDSSYLVGCLSALMAKKAGGDTVGVVGGEKIPPVDTFLAGYKGGALKCSPGIKVLVGYSQSFTDTAACKTVAQNQIDAGSKVEFQVAGPCGLGVLDAAKEGSVWGVGVDVDQSYLGKHILTSAIKRVDRGVYLTVKAAAEGKFVGGKNLVFNLSNAGVTLGKISPSVPASYMKKVNAIKAQIIAGKIKVPTKVG
jgi:basic membrane protein A